MKQQKNTYRKDWENSLLFKLKLFKLLLRISAFVVFISTLCIFFFPIISCFGIVIGCISCTIFHSIHQKILDKVSKEISLPRISKILNEYM